MKQKIIKLITGTALLFPLVAAAQGWNLANIGGFGLPGGSITYIVRNLLGWLLMLLGIIGVIGFVISGIIYLVSTGDENTIDKAKRAMTYSIIGVVVGLSGLVIIQAIHWALSGYSFF